MNVEIRIYKRFDTDLLALHDAGYSVSKMMAESLSAYANGYACHYFIDEIVPFDMNDKKSIRLRLKIRNDDYNTITLLQNIKHGCRSNFCKLVFRNSLIQQNLCCYFADMTKLPVHVANAKTINPLAFFELKNCSDYRQMVQHYHVMGQHITVKHEDGYKLSAMPYMHIEQPSASPSIPVSYSRTNQGKQLFSGLPATTTSGPNISSTYNTTAHRHEPVLTPQQTPTVQIYTPAPKSIVGETTGPPLILENQTNEKTSEQSNNAALMSLFDSI